MAKEIEHKYLIKTNIVELAKLYDMQKTYITQTYLQAESGERRVRQTMTNITGTLDYTARFFYTEKYPIDNGLKREENEKSITYAQYEKYRQEADTESKPISKVRFTFFIDGQKYELDCYDFESEYSVLEVEVESEDTEFPWPKAIELIRDVTTDKRFKNRQLAKTQCLPII